MVKELREQKLSCWPEIITLLHTLAGHLLGGYRSKGTSIEKFCPLSVNTRIYCKGRIPVLRIVLWFPYIAETSLLSQSSRKHSWRHLKTFCFQRSLLSGILLLLLDDQIVETTSAFTFQASSECSQIFSIRARAAIFTRFCFIPEKAPSLTGYSFCTLQVD